MSNRKPFASVRSLRTRLIGKMSLLCATALLFAGPAFAQLPPAPQVADQIRIGWNVGNTMEAICGETAWGNPAVTQQLINSVKAAGFNAIRIPAAWDCHANQQTQTIDAAWMARVKQVVDYAYSQDMYVVLNIHWDGGWLEEHPLYSYQAAVNQKQNAYWTQIATAFRDYNERYGATVILTSHYSGATPRYPERVLEIFLDNLGRFMAGEELRNVVDRRLDEQDPGAQLPPAGPHDVLRVGQPEGHEQQPRLVHVAVVLVDDGDLGVLDWVQPAQPVGREGAPGAGAQDDDAVGHHTPAMASGRRRCRGPAASASSKQGTHRVCPRRVRARVSITTSPHAAHVVQPSTLDVAGGAAWTSWTS